MLYKRELVNSFETIGYSYCIMMNTVYGPKWSFYSCCNYIGLLRTGFMQVMYLGRALCTKETLPDFLKWRRVTRHPLVFCGLMGSQRTPGNGVSHRTHINKAFLGPFTALNIFWLHSSTNFSDTEKLNKNRRHESRDYNQNSTQSWTTRK